MRVAWMADTSLLAPGEDGYIGYTEKYETIKQDLRYLTDRNPELVIHGGDLVSVEPTSVPHVENPERYQTWWKMVEELSVEDITYAIPGNHDVPVQRFLKSNPNAVWRAEFQYPREQTSIFLINTVGPGVVSGSRSYSGGGQRTIGSTRGYVPQTDLYWLEERLEDTPESWNKLLFAHHHLYWSSNETLRSYNDEPVHEGKQLYDVVLNARRVHDLLSNYQRVVVCQAHLFQDGEEGFSKFEGVNYIHTSHYYMKGEFNTFNEIEADGTGVRVSHIDSNSHDRQISFNSKEVEGW